ncbi:MAG: adenosyl-hopene transferase HpnH [Rhodospirillaceae bacterium]|nr:adenosyl-hopene transferase HpnH [Rhodospirillaceae bacterium]MBT7486213.1 adenosyl-hopene transferase HpnH [Rhodospirillales bacterium]MBT4703450.1 adenosyl-hopene transferase HpnH [Rhodospirillaceae bacterium]MBT5034286.1 adenosyl-hopene transferase HpnH [Rhodospirillaceae bacterium]MBT6218141.1 adenosyl-hopene transferase HpnH [Rhodospirillaceae bacterium]
MAVPVIQQIRVGSYIMKQRFKGVEKYPLVLMLEPLFRCNLACPGCGKIDYEDKILNKRLSAQQCLDAVDECGAPVVSIPGGEPLIHKEIKEIVDGIVARKKFVYLCTNALLMEKNLDKFTPSPYLTFSVHLDGPEEHHDKAVAQPGTFKRAVSAIREAKKRGFRVNINCTLFDQLNAEEAAEFFTFANDDLGVEGITISPGYAYERAEDQESFLSRTKTKNLFRDIFRIGKKTNKKWRFSQSSLFMDFLAGNQSYTCTPWGNPTRNIFGWQKPCYLIGEGYTQTFKELMEDTEWDKYGTGNYEKCADCMVHCGYEASAVTDTVKHPLKALKVFLGGYETEAPMAPEISLENQRPAEFVFEGVVQTLTERAEAESESAKQSDAA